MIKIGDLVRIKDRSSYIDENTILDEKSLTGVVVDVTSEHAPNSQGDEPPDYWIKVIFLDETKSTLFHDEVEIISERNESR